MQELLPMSVKIDHPAEKLTSCCSKKPLNLKQESTLDNDDYFYCFYL